MTNSIKTFIIAEVGVNHNGSLKKALKYIDIAATCGADAVKFQTFDTNLLVTKHAKKANYQINKLNKNETQFQMLKKLKFTDKMHKACMKKSKKKKIIFLSSAFDINSLKYLKKFKLKYFKVPSGELNNIPYLEFLGKLNSKILLSTGMSNLKEIDRAVKTLVKCGTKKEKISLMQCTSAYPAPNNELNLNVITTLKKKFKLNIGFSDHSLGIEASLAAVALGASIIEKHITLDTKMKGPDHKASLNPKEFKLLVDNIRKVEIMLGDNNKKVTKSEKKNIKIVRKSIVALKDISKNEKFSSLNIICKRPGTGISPIHFKKIIGKKAKVNFKKDELIKT